MNYHPDQPAARKLPDIAGFSQWRRLMRISNLMMVAMSWLVVMGTASLLNAADLPVTNSADTNPVVSLSTNVPATTATNAFNVLDDQYRLVMGDQLSFQIIEDRDDPVHLVVTDSGDLQVPYIGRYPAVGKTCKELALALKMELEKEYYKQATVIIAVDSKPRSRGKIYIVGAVGAPGPQEISSDEVLTASKAILRAGGLTGFADGKNVKVTRSTGAGPGDEKTIIVNVSQIFEKGRTEDDLTLQPGDLIYVPERMIRF